MFVDTVEFNCFLLGLDSIEHTLNEVEDMLQSLVRRMIKSEMEDFELVRELNSVMEVNDYGNDINNYPPKGM